MAPSREDQIHLRKGGREAFAIIFTVSIIKGLICSRHLPVLLKMHYVLQVNKLCCSMNTQNSYKRHLCNLWHLYANPYRPRLKF